jgi:glycosyltransferase involved in cell wall biosynthesis
MSEREACTISFVLLAYNEEADIEQAIADCREVGQRHFDDYEVIVIDDGSSDATAQRARDASRGDVRVLSHPRNLGMGASMRDGYLAAEKSYIAHLPGDRQVRAEALIAMRPLCSPETVVLSTFANPPSGAARVFMSIVFRQLTRRVARLQVNFAGTYLFHRQWLARIDHDRADSQTFLYSFQLLELFRRAGARFENVVIRPYPREQGKSREATPARIARMFTEIARARLRSE